MTFKAHEWLDAIAGDKRVSARCAAVLSAIANTGDNETGECYPGHAKLAARLHRGELYVRRGIAEGIELGYVVLTRRASGNEHSTKPNRRAQYRLTVPATGPHGPLAESATGTHSPATGPHSPATGPHRPPISQRNSLKNSRRGAASENLKPSEPDDSFPPQRGESLRDKRETEDPASALASALRANRNRQADAELHEECEAATSFASARGLSPADVRELIDKARANGARFASEFRKLANAWKVKVERPLSYWEEEKAAAEARAKHRREMEELGL